MQGSRSQVCNTINYVRHIYGVPKQNAQFVEILDVISSVQDVAFGSICEEDIIHSQLIRDLIETRDSGAFSFLSHQETQDLIITLCTD